MSYVPSPEVLSPIYIVGFLCRSVKHLSFVQFKKIGSSPTIMSFRNLWVNRFGESFPLTHTYSVFQELPDASSNWQTEDLDPRVKAQMFQSRCIVRRPSQARGKGFATNLFMLEYFEYSNCHQDSRGVEMPSPLGRGLYGKHPMRDQDWSE